MPKILRIRFGALEDMGGFMPKHASGSKTKQEGVLQAGLEIMSFPKTFWMSNPWVDCFFQICT